MKRSIIVIITSVLLIIMLSSCAPVTTAPERSTIDFVYVHDWSEPKIPSGATRILKEQEEKITNVEEAPIEEDIFYEEYYEPVYYEPVSYSTWSGSGDGFMQQGVREYDGRTETWYSSNVTYHVNTDQWTVDEEGYYRDNEGHYVVAASDMEQGTVFEGSKGECIVLDDGASPGVTDYYTAF